MKKIIIRWLPVALWMVVIFSFSSRPDLPSNRIDWIDFIFKKSAHVAEFTIFTLLAYRAFSKRSPDHAILLAIAYAFSDEIHQFFTPGRGAHLTDVAIDSLGIIIATFFINHTVPLSSRARQSASGGKSRDLLQKIWKKFT